jgi:hypothetical protein
MTGGAITDRRPLYCQPVIIGFDSNGIARLGRGIGLAQTSLGLPPFGSESYFTAAAQRPVFPLGSLLARMCSG